MTTRSTRALALGFAAFLGGLAAPARPGLADEPAAAADAPAAKPEAPEKLEELRFTFVRFERRMVQKAQSPQGAFELEEHVVERKELTLQKTLEALYPLLPRYRKAWGEPETARPEPAELRKAIQEYNAMEGGALLRRVRSLESFRIEVTRRPTVAP